MNLKAGLTRASFFVFSCVRRELGAAMYTSTCIANVRCSCGLVFEVDVNEGIWMIYVSVHLLTCAHAHVRKSSWCTFFGHCKSSRNTSPKKRHEGTLVQDGKYTLTICFSTSVFNLNLLGPEASNVMYFRISSITCASTAPPPLNHQIREPQPRSKHLAPPLPAQPGPPPLISIFATLPVQAKMTHAHKTCGG